MPPRYAYWTIIFGGQPTSFRAATGDELLPTFNRIKAKHPDAVMMWFARGRLWKSPEEAREALIRRRSTRPHGPPSHPRDWRPGGEHKDPRARFKVPRDVRRARFRARDGRKREK